MLIYHMALAAEWDAAARAGAYTGSTLGRSLSDEGFVHCCFADQLAGVADRFYRGREDVVLLAIDTSRLRAGVRNEQVGDVPGLFPHIYGEVPLDAVAAAAHVPPGPDGTLDIESAVQALGDRT